MYKFAQNTDVPDKSVLVYLLQELQDRISLEVPVPFIKEEGIKENDLGDRALYYLVWYNQAENEIEGKGNENVGQKVESLVKDIFSDQKEIFYQVKHETKSRNVNSTTVTVVFDPKRKVKKAEVGPVPLEQVPVTCYIGEDILNIAQDKNQLVLMVNGEIVVDGIRMEEEALALSSLFMLCYNSYIAQRGLSSVDDSNKEFLTGLSGFLQQLPNNEESYKALKKFFELVTLQELPDIGN